MIKTTCSCGAMFEIHSTGADESYRFKEFLEAHEICRKKVKIITESECSPEEKKEWEE